MSVAVNSGAMSRTETLVFIDLSVLNDSASKVFGTMRFSRVIGFGIIVLIVISLIVMGAEKWTFSGTQNSPPAMFNTPSASSQSLDSHPDVHIDGDRLFRDVEHLAFVRYSDAERLQARQYILEQLQQAGWSPEELPFVSHQSGNSVEGINILAMKPGEDTDTGTILLGAHYDTVARSPGADDNASAVATVLELARLISDVPTSYSLAIALFDLEESGLLGSTEFVQDMSRSLNVNGAIILEMLGYACHTAGCQTYPQALPIDPPSGIGNFLAIIGDMGHSFLLDAFQPSEQTGLPIFTLQIPTLGSITPDLLRSDHVPFWRNGIGAVMVTDTANFRNPYYHQPNDTPETIDQEFLLNSATLVLDALIRLLQTVP